MIRFDIRLGMGATVPSILAPVQLNFNTVLCEDPDAKYVLFFTNDEAGDNKGFNFDTENAIVVKDADGEKIEGKIAGRPSISFMYDYAGNDQRGLSSTFTDAPVTLVCIGLHIASYMKVSSTLTKHTNSITIVAGREYA